MVDPAIDFDVTATAVDGVRVIAARGELDMLTLPHFEKVLLRSGDGRLVVDFTELDFMDASSLAPLVREHARTTAAPLHLVCTEDSIVRRILEVTKLDGMFMVCGSRDEGLQRARATV